MATITRVRRVANPKRGRRFSALRNKKGRFVKLSSRRKVSRASRPKRKHNARRVVRRRSNPVLIELSALNPRKRRKTSVAKRRRVAKANPRRRRRTVRRTNVRRRRTSVARVVRRRRRRNPVAVAPVRRRRRHVRRRHVVHHRRRRMNGRRRMRRNPIGGGGLKNYAVMVGGGLVGVAATKYIPTLIPSSITASLGSSPIMSIVVAGAGAFAAGYLAKRFMGEAFGDAVLFGGLMQTGSMILSAFAPAPLNTALALSGLGDIVPGWFAVPQNSVTNRAPVAMMPSKGVSGFAPGGFGFRRR
jgi:hypothetical protein